MAVAALERRPRVLLVAVRRHKSRVDINDQRRLRAGLVVGGVLPGQLPDPGAGGGPGRVDRRQRPRGVGGERVDRPRHRRVRRDRAVDTGLLAKHGDVGEAVAAERERDRQVQHQLRRVVDRGRLAPRPERLSHRPVQAGCPDRLQQRDATGVGHDAGSRRVSLDSRVQPAPPTHLREHSEA